MCDAELSAETRYGLCDSCKMPHNVDFCFRCGRAKNNISKFCDECGRRKWEFSSARSSFDFTGEVKNLVYRLKYGNQRFLADYFGEFMADTYYKSDFSVDAITYVPLHEKRLRQRGYNQSELLAKRVGELTRAPVFELLNKTTFAKNMAKLGAKERQESIKGSFVINNQEFSRFFSTMRGIDSEYNLSEAKILLIDDIFTTGATTNECAKALKKAGIGDVSVLCFASVASRVELI